MHMKETGKIVMAVRKREDKKRYKIIRGRQEGKKRGEKQEKETDQTREARMK